MLQVSLGALFMVSGGTFAALNSDIQLPPTGNAGDIITVEYWNQLINGTKEVDERTREITNKDGKTAIGGVNKDDASYQEPQETLDVRGAIKIQNTASENSGTIRFDEIAKDFEGYTGDEWKSLTKGDGTGAGGDCSLVDSGISFSTGVATASCSSGSISYSSVEWQGKDGYFPSLGIRSTQTSASINCLGNACKLHLICCAGGAGSGGENDVLAQLNCSDGNIPKWNTSLAKWACGIDEGTQKLPWTEFEGDVYRKEGNVGIGTGVDKPNTKLDVRGDIHMNQEKVATEPWVNAHNFLTTELDPQVGTNTTDALSKWNGSALISSGIFEKSGSIGIGTNSPSSKLDVRGNIKMNSQKVATEPWVNAQGFLKSYIDTNTQLSESQVDTYANNNGYLKSYNETDPQVGWNTTNKLSKWNGSALVSSGVFENGGKVGIGTTSPISKLDVRGQIFAQGGIFINDGNQDGAQITFANNRAGEIGDSYNIDVANGRLRFFYQPKNGSGEESISLRNNSLYVRTDLILDDTGGGMANDYINPSNISADLNFINVSKNDYVMRGYNGSLRFISRHSSENSNEPGFTETIKMELSHDGDLRANSYNNLSDKRLKKNIKTISGLDTIMKMRGVTFDWKESGKSTVGLIAQEVEKVLPDLVSTSETTGLKAVAYSNVVAPLIEAVKELKTEKDSEILALKKENKALKESLEELMLRVEALEKK